MDSEVRTFLGMEVISSNSSSVRLKRGDGLKAFISRLDVVHKRVTEEDWFNFSFNVSKDTITLYVRETNLFHLGKIYYDVVAMEEVLEVFSELGD